MKRLIGLAVLGGLLAGCTQSGNSASSGTAATAGSGTLRVAIQQDVKNLNPLLNSNTTDGFIARLMFEPLVSADDKGGTVPMLASPVPTLENKGISKDGLTITYHLRKDVKWNDGVPVTSKDVKWSWQAIMNTKNNIISRHGYDVVSSVDTPDAYTVVVHLKQKFSPFINSFFADSDQPYSVAPEHVLAKYADINQIPFNANPNVSDGPFRFVRWVHGDHIELAANDQFFMGKPGLRNIYLRIVPSETTTVNLLRTHDIDWMFQASVSNYPSLRNIPGVKLVFVDVNGYEDVQLNVQRPALQDVRVRQAVAYAIDKPRIVQTLTYGTQPIALWDMPKFMWAYDPNVTPVYTHNVQMAKKLLAQAGYTRGANGMVSKGGEPLTLVMVSNNSNVTRRKNTVEVQAMLREVGIDAQIKYYDGDVLFAPVGEGGILQGGKFDLALAGWYAGVDPDDSSQFACANVAPAGYDYSRYCSPEMDAAQKMALENYDLPTRKKAYSQIQHLLARDLPEIFFYDLRTMEPVSENFKGFRPNPVIESWNAWEWSI
ncbi:MAG: peptide ABC transporter substrate-binding protein [Candidatus Baltobacteraceae bacterium]